MPIHGTRPQDVGPERAAEHGLGGTRGLEQAQQIDPRLDPHLVQHRDDVLGGNVAGRARRHRAAAQLAEARLEGVDALLQRSEQVGESLAAGVVKVGGQLDSAEALARRREELPHLARVRHPGGVPEGDLGAAGRGQPRGDPKDALRRHLPLVGTAEGGRDHTLAAQPRLAGALQRPLQPAQRLLYRGVDVAAVVGL